MCNSSKIKNIIINNENFLIEKFSENNGKFWESFCLDFFNDTHEGIFLINFKENNDGGKDVYDVNNKVLVQCKCSSEKQNRIKEGNSLEAIADGLSKINFDEKTEIIFAVNYILSTRKQEDERKRLMEKMSKHVKSEKIKIKIYDLGNIIMTYYNKNCKSFFEKYRDIYLKLFAQPPRNFNDQNEKAIKEAQKTKNNEYLSFLNEIYDDEKRVNKYLANMYNFRDFHDIFLSEEELNKQIKGIDNIVVAEVIESVNRKKDINNNDNNYDKRRLHSEIMEEAIQLNNYDKLNTFWEQLGNSIKRGIYGDMTCHNNVFNSEEIINWDIDEK